MGYLLSAHLRPDALDHTVATDAARLLDGPLRHATIARSAIERLVVARIFELHPSHARLDSEQWAELCQLVAILARFEQYFRAGSVVLRYLAAPISHYGDDLDELARALIDEPTRRDLDTLGHATVEDHQAGLGEASRVYIGPSFAQSLALGGADADVVYDGTLLDLKSTSQARIAGRDEIWQLMGYLLADTDDAFAITRLGFAALRRRRSVFWLAERLICELAGGQTRPVSDLRQEFAALLAPLVGQHGLMRRRSLQSRMSWVDE